MQQLKGDKLERVLSIYSKLMHGCVISKAEEAAHYGVNERSIQRDIDDIRTYLENRTNVDGCFDSVVYDRNVHGYRLQQIQRVLLTNSEILAVCKILLDSRAFTKAEMQSILDRMVLCCTPAADKSTVAKLIGNELFHYVEPRHRTEFIGTMWQIGQAIQESRYIKIDYVRTKDKKTVTRRLQPAAIMFSEYYFYLTAFIDDDDVRKDFDVLNDSFPTIYRIDRIQKLRVLDERFKVPYRDRFEEGEFRKRIQFMYGGKLQRVRFRYRGSDVDAILDRLPTAEIVFENDGVYTITAEVFGKGIDMWLRSQGDNVEIIER